MTDLPRGRGRGAVRAILAGMCAEAHDSHAVLLTYGDPAVWKIVERQHGVVSLGQLQAAGLGRGAIQWRVRRRRLHPLHRGVYAVGHTRLSYRGRLWAAVLACGGPGAAILSHRSAAAAWELLPTPAGPTDVTTLHAAHSMPGVRVHRTTTLDLEEDVVRQADGLPVTAVARTLQDLATVLSPHRLERVCHRAQHLRLLDAAVLGAQAGRGSRALANALATLENADPQITRSELEERFLVLIGEAQLPPPLVNAHIAGHEVDFLWPDHHLIAETDGAASHLTPTAFEADRRRDARLQAVGYRVVRFTYRQVTDQPIAVVTMLRRLLAPAPPPAPSDRSARPRASRGGRSP